MNENFELIKKAGYVSVSRLVNLSGFLLMMIALARYLSKSEFGNYDQLWLIYNTVAPVLSFAFTSSVYYFGSQENPGKYVFAVFAMLALASLAISLSLLVFKDIVSSFLNNPYFGKYIFLFAPFFVFSIPSLITDAVFVLRGDFKRLFLFTVVPVFLQVLTVFYAIFSGKGIDVILSAFSLIAFLKFSYSIFYIRKSFKTGESFFNEALQSVNVFPEISKFVFPLVIGHISAIFSRQVDKYIVAGNFTTDVYAVYTIGARELPIVPLITSSFASIIFSTISRFQREKRREEIVSLINDAVRSTAIIVVPAFVFLLLYAKEFIVFFFSEKYSDSVSIFRVYLFFLPVRILLYSSIITALGKQHIYMLISFLDLFINFILGIVLVKFLGIIGPAIAVVLSTYIEAFLMLQFILKELGMKNLLQVIAFKYLFALYFGTFAIGLVSYVPTFWIENYFLRLSVGGVIFSLFYFLLLYFGFGVRPNFKT